MTANFLIDMDGVVADFEMGLCNAAAEIVGFEGQVLYDELIEGNLDVISGLAEMVFHRNDALGVSSVWKLADNANFWATLPTLPGIAAVQWLCSDPNRLRRTYILSSSAGSVYSAQGKVEWLRKHLPALSNWDRIIFARDKGVVINDGDVMFDDMDRTLNPCARKGAHTIQWGKDNQTPHVGHPERVSLTYQWQDQLEMRKTAPHFLTEFQRVIETVEAL